MSKKENLARILENDFSTCSAPAVGFIAVSAVTACADDQDWMFNHVIASGVLLLINEWFGLFRTCWHFCSNRAGSCRTFSRVYWISTAFTFSTRTSIDPFISSTFSDRRWSAVAFCNNFAFSCKLSCKMQVLVATLASWSTRNRVYKTKT